MGKKRKLRKQLRKRELEDETALVICVGKHCCAREDSCALVEATRAYAAQTHSTVEIVTVGCLDICKKGPIAATYPEIKFKKHVTPKRARKLLDKLGGRRG
jgi:(2Fe-2S) ferredoxin